MNRQNDAKDLKIAVKEFIIFIDTSSLLEPGADRFWEKIIPYLERECAKVIILYAVYNELRVHCVQKDPSKPDLNAIAINAKNNLLRLHRDKYILFCGKRTDTFADHVFLMRFRKYMLDYNLMLITQDKNLASDILNIGKSKSVKTQNRIMVACINIDGDLRKFNPYFPYQPLNIPFLQKILEKFRIFR